MAMAMPSGLSGSMFHIGSMARYLSRTRCRYSASEVPVTPAVVISAMHQVLVKRNRELLVVGVDQPGFDAQAPVAGLEIHSELADGHHAWRRGDASTQGQLSYVALGLAEDLVEPRRPRCRVEEILAHKQAQTPQNPLPRCLSAPGEVFATGNDVVAVEVADHCGPP